MIVLMRFFFHSKMRLNDFADFNSNGFSANIKTMNYSKRVTFQTKTQFAKVFPRGWLSCQLSTMCQSQVMHQKY
jgi:hypothetical protein